MIFLLRNRLMYENPTFALKNAVKALWVLLIIASLPLSPAFRLRDVPNVVQTPRYDAHIRVRDVATQSASSPKTPPGSSGIHGTEESSSLTSFFWPGLEVFGNTNESRNTYISPILQRVAAEDVAGRSEQNGTRNIVSMVNYLTFMHGASYIQNLVQHYPDKYDTWLTQLRYSTEIHERIVNLFTPSGVTDSVAEKQWTPVSLNRNLARLICSTNQTAYQKLYQTAIEQLIPHPISTEHHIPLVTALSEAETTTAPNLSTNELATWINAEGRLRMGHVHITEEQLEFQIKASATRLPLRVAQFFMHRTCLQHF